MSKVSSSAAWPIQSAPEPPLVPDLGDPSADHGHELVAVRGLDPVGAAAAGDVRRRPALAHHALEPLLPGEADDDVRVVECLGQVPTGAVEVELLEERAAVGVREAGDVVAVDAQDVEDDERRRTLAGQLQRLRVVADVDAGDDGVQLRNAEVGVDGDQLAVEDQPVREADGTLDDLRIRQRDVAAGAVREAEPPAAGLGEGAHAVPLDLVDPLGAGRWDPRGGGRDREHGAHAVNCARSGSRRAGQASFRRANSASTRAPSGTTRSSNRA